MDHVLTDNKNKNKNHRNDAIENEPKFDNAFNLYSRTKDPLKLVTAILQGGKKQREITVAGITCLWDSGGTNIIIKRRHTKYYERMMQSNIVEYSTSAELYCTIHDIKVHFCIPELSSSNIIEHRFHFNDNKGELGIGYDMIITCDLIVQLGLTTNFKSQIFDGMAKQYP